MANFKLSALIHGLWKFQFEMTFSRVDFDVQAIFSFNSTSCQNKIFAEFFNLNTIRSTEILIKNSDDNAKQLRMWNVSNYWKSKFKNKKFSFDMIILITYKSIRFDHFRHAHFIIYESQTRTPQQSMWNNINLNE